MPIKRKRTTMKKTRFRHNSVQAVLDNAACSGCGACTVACTKNSLQFVYGERFNFPRVDSVTCHGCKKCLKVCPGAFLLRGIDPGFSDQIGDEFGAHLVHARDDSIRTDAASGGFITSLLLHLLDTKQITGAVVTRSDGETPLVAKSFLAQDRESLLAARGSKYAPVSACTILSELLQREGRYAIVGTPCMLEGAAKLEEIFPALKSRIALRIGFVCAGMASRVSTRRYIEDHGGVKISQVGRIAYRGGGWPGRFRVFGKDEQLLMDKPLIGGSLTHVVGRDHYLRCYNCLDHWGHFADIVVSDPWSEQMVKEEKLGWSAVLNRTARGRTFVQSLLDTPAVESSPISLQEMLSYNKHLVLSPAHDRHAWMAMYQVVFRKRMGFVPLLLRRALSRTCRGVRTTLRARVEQGYYR